MPTLREACSDCNAEYTLKHSLDKDYYQPKFCPFCGAEIPEDCEDEEEE